MPPLSSSSDRPDLTAVRNRLNQLPADFPWRTLEEAAGTCGFQEATENEFRPGWQDPPDRRQAMKLMAASLAMSGLTACSGLPARTIVPYVREPEQLVSVNPLYYATAMPFGQRALGLVIESNLGRPTKVEGNPDHPASMGATDVFAQASVLTLWDPDRSQAFLRDGQISDWATFLAVIEGVRKRLKETNGAGFRILSETVLSPTLARQIHELLGRYPSARWHQYDPVNRDAARGAALRVFGEDLSTLYRFDKAAIVVSLDSDFLSALPGSVAYARQFARRRNQDRDSQQPMVRLYVAEPMPTVTGAVADHRIRLRAGEIESLARALAGQLGVEVAGNTSAGLPDRVRTLIPAIAADLKAHTGASIVIPGEYQPPSVHALAHLMNHVLGNQGETVVYTEPVEPNPVEQATSLNELLQEMRAGDVDTLLILGGNPVYSVPRHVNFKEALEKVRTRFHSSLYNDETSHLCNWHIPRAHFLEIWSDVRSYDGTCSVIQPLIAPLYGGKSDHEILAALAGDLLTPAIEIVRQSWRTRAKSGDFDAFWRQCLDKGAIPDTAWPAKAVSVKDSTLPASPPASGDLPEIIFRPDPTVWDGRFANNAWLQELPKPITTLTWDNAAMISPATAERLRLSNEDVVELKLQGRTIEAPVWIVPGHADEAVTVHLGYGRPHAGRVGTGVGFDAYELRVSNHPWHSGGLNIRQTGKRHRLAEKQSDQTMQSRDLVRLLRADRYRSGAALEENESPSASLSLFPDYRYTGYAWGMAIDLNACVGCGVCTIACQAENNIPVVGKDEVLRGRAMHWIRVDRYFHGPLDDPKIYFEPVPCMQCENAPCELVCPVGATTHSDEGLNQMIYNRCVGTRYCSNNCPYKVRRFNFLQFADWSTPSLRGVRNPDVTVRSRGVMEKCTYCVQRIQEAKIRAERQERPIRDGEILTACQQACPTQAIVFGNINDPNSRVSSNKKLPRNYTLLEELNTRPRTTYLARLTNRNPGLKES